jgi:hypothetical protein
LSTFIAHFTRDQGATKAKDNLVNILKYGRIQARSVYGMASDLAAEVPEIAETQRVVCFTETPLEHAWMMNRPIEDRQISLTGFGLAFTKTFARKHSVNPVWYLDITPGGPGRPRNWLTNPINTLVEQAKDQAWDDELDEGDIDRLAEAPILRLTPFIEQMGPTKESKKEFWWEREWRCVGDLLFAPEDVVVVFAPEDEHDGVKQALNDHAASLEAKAKRGSEPAENPTARQLRRLSESRIVDASWGLEHMIGTLAGVTDLGPFPER